MDERWAVLVTKNTAKKHKKWSDGIISARRQGARTRVIVYDDAGSVLEEAHVPADAVCDGGEFTLERYLVQVDTRLSAGAPGAPAPCAEPTPRITSDTIPRRPPTSLPASKGFHPPGRRKLIDAQWRDQAAAQPNAPVGSAQRSADGQAQRPVLGDVTAAHQHVHFTAGQGRAGTSCSFPSQLHTDTLHPMGRMPSHPPHVQPLLQMYPPHMPPHPPHPAPVSFPPAVNTSSLTLAAQLSARRGGGTSDVAGAFSAVAATAYPPDPHTHAVPPPRRSASSVLRMLGVRGPASDEAAATAAPGSKHSAAVGNTRVGVSSSSQVTPHPGPNCVQRTPDAALNDGRGTPHTAPSCGECVDFSSRAADMATSGNACPAASTLGMRMHSEARPVKTVSFQLEPQACGRCMAQSGGADDRMQSEEPPSAAHNTKMAPLRTDAPPRRVGGFLPPRQAPIAGAASGFNRPSIASTHSLPDPAARLATARLATQRQPRDAVNRPRPATPSRGPLIFPSAVECAAPGAAPIPVPGAVIEYSSLAQYTELFSGLLFEQVNLQLWQLAQRVHSLLASGRAPAQLRAFGVPIFPGSELVVYRQRGSGGRSGSRGGGGGRRGGGGRSHRGRGTKRRNASHDGDSCDDDDCDSAFDVPDGDRAAGDAVASGAGGAADPTLILTLRGAAREHSSANALDDLWILLRCPACGDTIDERSEPLFVRSLWHAPSAEGRLGVALVCGTGGGAQGGGRGSGPGGHSASAHNLPATSKYLALRGPNISDLQAQLGILASLSLPQSPPALRFLLSPRNFPAAPPIRVDAPVTQLLHDSIREFNLNAEQAEVLRRVARWFESIGSGQEAAPGGRVVEGEEEAGGAGSGDPSSAVTAGFGGPLGAGESTCAGEASPPVVLVHGAFGAGKSHLLAAALWMIRRVLADGEAPSTDSTGGRGSRLGMRERGGAAGGCGGQVLLASLTNVAVDNVLQVLIEHGEGDALLRIGSARRIARSVIKHSTHGRLGKAEEASVRAELNAALNHAPTGERAGIMAALAELESGGMAARARAVRRFPILGATCCATRLPVMEGLRCDVVVLDECSQMTEPASLLPIARLSASRVLCMGDPCQLPPTLLARPAMAAAVASPVSLPPTHQPQHVLPCGAPPLQHPHLTHDLSLTLFERLARGGVPPVLLRAQYRCHPHIARVASSLFYQGQLVDGLGEAAASARAPLLHGLPTLGFSQVSGAEQPAGNGSMTNRAEAVRCLQIIKSLLASGLPPSAIGVICLYRAQAELLGTMLSGGEGGGGAGANQRDAGVGSSCGGGRMPPPSNHACSWDAVGEDGAPESRGNQDEEMREITVSTVDAFQGAEREVIIVSTCRTHSLGFVASPRRLNVTVTRARRHLLLVGSATALMSDPRWATILDAAGSIPEECTRGEPMQPTSALDDLAPKEEEDGRREGLASAEAGTAGADVEGERGSNQAQGRKRALTQTPSVGSACSKPAFDILAVFDETDSESGDAVAGLGGAGDDNSAASCGEGDGIEGEGGGSEAQGRDQSDDTWGCSSQALEDERGSASEGHYAANWDEGRVMDGIEGGGEGGGAQGRDQSDDAWGDGSQAWEDEGHYAANWAGGRGMDGIEGEGSDRDPSDDAWVSGGQTICDETRPCGESMPQEEPMQDALDCRGVAEATNVRCGTADQLVVGDEAAYRAGDGSLTAVSVVALHNDDPERGAYVTVRLPDGRERHTEVMRLLTVDQHAQATGDEKAEVLPSREWQEMEFEDGGFNEGGRVQPQQMRTGQEVSNATGLFGKGPTRSEPWTMPVPSERMAAALPHEDDGHGDVMDARGFGEGSASYTEADGGEARVLDLDDDGVGGWSGYNSGGNSSGFYFSG